MVSVAMVSIAMVEFGHLVPHAVAHIEHDGAAEQQRLELVGVADARRVEQVLEAALVLELHEALVLLVATW